MNQDNNNVELSGTLGSLNDAAINNLTGTMPNDIANNDAIQLATTTEPIIEEEIEVLDAPSVTEGPVAQPVVDNNENNFNIDTPVIPDLNPIPTNFDIGEIGSVPPVDPIGKKNRKQKKNNTLFIFLVIVFILAIGALIFYYLRVSKGTLSNAVTTKDLSFELGVELPSDIKEYASFKSISSNNCILDTSKVDINTVGEYEYSITCGNQQYTGKITLKDTQAPVVETKTLVKKVNSTIEPQEFIEKCTDGSECSYQFAEPELLTTNLAQVGTYDLNIIITDKAGNSNTTPVKLIVIESDIKVYINCGLSDQTIDNFNGIVSYNDKIAITPDSKYAGLYFKIIEYTAKTEEEYNQIKSEYNNGNLTINNGQGKPIFDDNNLTITFEEMLSGDSEFGTDYSSIKTFYETTKNYKCSISNAN